jgi:hypothetical protein
MARLRAIGRLLAGPAVRGRALSIMAALAWCLLAVYLAFGNPSAPLASAHQALPDTPTNTPTLPSTATDAPTSATTPTAAATATGSPQATATKSATTPTAAATATTASGGGNDNGNSNGGGPVGPQPTRVNLGQPAVGSSDSGGGISGFSPTQLTSNGLIIFTTLGCLLGVGGIAALAIGSISLVSDGWGPLLVVLLLGNRRGRRRFARRPTDDGWGD